MSIGRASQAVCGHPNCTFFVVRNTDACRASGFTAYPDPGVDGQPAGFAAITFLADVRAPSTILRHASGDPVSCGASRVVYLNASYHVVQNESMVQANATTCRVPRPIGDDGVTQVMLWNRVVAGATGAEPVELGRDPVANLTFFAATRARVLLPNPSGNASAFAVEVLLNKTFAQPSDCCWLPVTFTDTSGRLFELADDYTYTCSQATSGVYLYEGDRADATVQLNETHLLKRFDVTPLDAESDNACGPRELGNRFAAPFSVSAIVPVPPVVTLPPSAQRRLDANGYSVALNVVLVSLAAALAMYMLAGLLSVCWWRLCRRERLEDKKKE